MKALVCEMCSSPNLIKKDGMYVSTNHKVIFDYLFKSSYMPV